MIRLENEAVAIFFDKESGSIVQIVDKQTQLEYLCTDLSSAPFRVELGGGTTSNYRHFSYSELGTNDSVGGYRLNWEVAEGVMLNATISLEASSKDIYFQCELLNQSSESVASLEYPIIPNIAPITNNGEDDYLSHSFATGFQIRNPSLHFTKEWRGFRYMPYPEGFSGSTMQFFSYYGQGEGGFTLPLMTATAMPNG